MNNAVEKKTIMWLLIEKKGYKSLEDFANDVGISKGFASQLANNKAKPSLDTYKKIEAVLGDEIKDHFF